MRLSECRFTAAARTMLRVPLLKDLVKYLRDDIKDFDWHKLIRNVLLFFRQQNKSATFLEEFRQKKIHIAIVVTNTEGQTDIVTLEIVLEEIKNGEIF